MAEPAGAVPWYLLLNPFLSPVALAYTLATTAGMMIYIAMDEFLPTAHRYGHGHSVIIGTVLGMMIIALAVLVL